RQEKNSLNRKGGISKNIKSRVKYLEIEKISKLVRDGQFPIQKLPIDFDYGNARAIERLSVLPNLKKQDGSFYLSHNIQWKVMLWCKHHNLTFEDFWDWAKKKDDSDQRMVKYEGYWNDDYNCDRGFVNS